jgi:hypothetical protein
MPFQGNKKALPSFRGYALRVERDVLEQRQVVFHLLWILIHPSQICSGMTKEQNLQIRNKTIITYCVGAQHVVRSLSFGWLCVRNGCVEQVVPQLHISRCSAALYIVFTVFAFGTGCLEATNAASAS